MRIILTCKTGKGKDSSEKDIGVAEDILEKMVFRLENMLKKYEWTKYKVLSDGAQFVFEK